MRKALPVFWCVDDETRRELAPLITIPKPEWVEWKPVDSRAAGNRLVPEFADYQELFREMSRRPRNSGRIK